MFVRLSYDLDSDSPSWPGNPKLDMRWHTSMDDGQPVNHTIFTLFAHYGTHLDTQLHWVRGGETIDSQLIDRFIYLAPVVVNVPKGAGEFITVPDLEPHAEAMQNKDCLLIRTGFSRQRTDDPDTYSANGPALHPDAARWLMEHFPAINCIGMDTVSIASPAHVPEAMETHRVLLGYYGGRWLVILEDLTLDFDLTGLVRLFALPLYLKGAEGSPCTIVAELDR